MERNLAVDAYISGLDGQERNTLMAWRERCLGLPDSFVEGIRYGMSCYSREGKPELAFAAQKRHLAIYLMRADVMAAHRGRMRSGLLSPTLP
jgi:hypothetical protein